MKKETKVQTDNNDINNDEASEKSNNLITIAIVTAILVFVIYIFISQFVTFKNNNSINSTLILEEHNPS